MSRTKRLVKRVILCAAVVVTIMSLTNSAEARIRPTHIVECELTALVPQQFSPGSPVTGTAHITCTPTPPDVSNTTVIIWRYDGGGNYSNISYKTLNTLGTD
jgi:hypothetical protein